MPEINQYTVSPRELTELIIKSANVREGRWFLMANFGFAPGNFGPAPSQLAPGVAVIIQSLGIQRELPEAKMPPEIVVDAAELARQTVESPPPREPTKSGRTKAST